MSDEYQTPKDLYKLSCEIADFIPQLDVCATFENRMCDFYIDKKLNALTYPISNLNLWCNPPHDKTKEFVLRMDDLWIEEKRNILMIIAAN